MQSLNSLLQKITSKHGTTTLVIEDPRMKPALMRKVVSNMIEIAPICFIDFDLQFSSLLQNAPNEFYARLVSNGLLVIQPDNDLTELVNFLAIPGFIRDRGVIILDSFNSLQNLLSSNSSPQRLKTANYRSFLLISVIQMIGRFYSNSMMIVNVAKSRPRLQDHTTIWEKVLVGGRMMKYKSDSIILASEMEPPRVKSIRGARLVVDFGSATNVEMEEEYFVDL